jgi:Family of unknown function (DUF6525)
MSNSYGTYRTNRYDDMHAYDHAPAPLRWIMRNTVADWAAIPLTDRYWERRRAQGHDAAMRTITAYMASRERAQTIAAYGPTHPEARA